MKFGKLVDIGYVITFAKFGVDQLEGSSLVSSQILELCFSWEIVLRMLL